MSDIFSIILGYFWKYTAFFKAVWNRNVRNLRPHRHPSRTSKLSCTIAIVIALNFFCDQLCNHFVLFIVIFYLLLPDSASFSCLRGVTFSSTCPFAQHTFAWHHGGIELLLLLALSLHSSAWLFARHDYFSTSTKTSIYLNKLLYVDE